MSLWVKGQLINDLKQIAILCPVALGKHRFFHFEQLQIDDT